MTMFNGAKHDVEDILASIRTSIADRSPDYEFDRREAHVTTLRGRSVIAEEAMEFELPAIFKTPAQPAAERPNLLGRLSEVLSANGPQQDWDRPRTVIPFGPAHGRMIEPPPVLHSANDAQPAPVSRAAPVVDDVKRVMPSFFDTRLNRMSQIAQAPEVEVQHEAPARQPQAIEPPTLPRSHDLVAGDFHNGEVEDAAAQLLRPILKQWLTENMPKIVEKALRSESGEDDTGSSSRY